MLSPPYCVTDFMQYYMTKIKVWLVNCVSRNPYDVIIQSSRTRYMRVYTICNAYIDAWEVCKLLNIVDDLDYLPTKCVSIIVHSAVDVSA